MNLTPIHLSNALSLALACSLASSLVGCDTNEPAPRATIARDDAARSGLERAHRAFAAGRAREMTDELLGVLTEPKTDEVARANAIELVDQAFEDGQGRLDSGFTRPPGMPWLRLVIQHGENDGAPAHLAVLNGGLEGDVELTSLRVVRSRDAQVLSSKEDGVGYFQAGGEGAKRFFYIHSAGSSVPIESGAYQIVWGYADGRSGVADVIVPSLHLAGLPVVEAPARGTAIREERPTIRWKAPGWIGDVGFGRVLVEARIMPARGPAPSEVWSMWEWSTNRTEMTVGREGAPEGASLERGRSYDLSVQYQWRLEYGELQLGAAARTAATFTVE